jgi:hypothetical protein
MAKKEREATKRREENPPLTAWEKESLPQKRADAIASGPPHELPGGNDIDLECLSASLDGDKLLIGIRIEAVVRRPGVTATYVGTKTVEVKAMVEEDV